MAAVLLGAGWLLREFVPGIGPYRLALVFAALGAACLINVALNRTFHCAITAPLFLITAGILALDAAGVWMVNRSILWPLVLIGVGVAFLLEMRFGTPGPAGR